MVFFEVFNDGEIWNLKLFPHFIYIVINSFFSFQLASFDIVSIQQQKK